MAVCRQYGFPRRFFGEIYAHDEPVVIVGLTKELDYAAGQLLPHVRRIIEMPRAVNDSVRISTPAETRRPAPVVGIRLESRAESRIGRLIGAVLFWGCSAASSWSAFSAPDATASDICLPADFAE